MFDYSNLDANVNSIFLSAKENLYIKSNSNNNNFNVDSEETILYYVFENIITIYKNNLVKLTLISNSILVSYHKKTAVYLICYDLVIVFCLLIFSILLFYLIVDYKNKVMATFLNLFTNKNIDKFFEMKLMIFKTILNSFDQIKCFEYEIKKQEIMMREEKIPLEPLVSITPDSKTKRTIKTEKGTLINLMSNHSRALTSKDKSSVRNLLSVKAGIKLKELDNSSMDIYCNEFLEQVKFNHLDLKVYSFGRIFLIIGALVLLVLNMIKTIENFTRFNALIKGNTIASNFLERMPKLCELILYYKISVVYNDVYFIRNEKAVESLHYNYYNISIDVTKEGIFNSLKDSRYSNIYYQFRVIQANLKMFMNDIKDQKILPNIRILENQLNTKDYCFYLAKAFTELVDELPKGNLLAGFVNMNKNLMRCKQIGNGINENPLSSILESILSVINNNYFDFINSKDKNISYFIGNKDIVRANLEIEYGFKRIHDSVMFLIKSDIDSMYDDTINSEIFFSIATIIIFVVLILIFLLFVIQKMKNYNTNLSYTLKRFRKALTQNKKI
jgi:hypothetical protein